jgi:hypothetical protein
MATYYKYAERSADSQVNWAEVGKGISDMLTEGAKLREEKKAAYEEAYRLDTERLINAPQGTWQDGNATVNNFAHDMMAQQLIDYRLLKSGVMNEREYTLRRENYKSGTETVFDLQKILQAERAKTIEAFEKGDLQAMNISNMADVEAYTDFANSKIEIDPYNPNINMSIYETKIIDGKEVRVIKNTSPVNVLKGQLLQKIPAFKLDERVNKDVESLGVDVDYIYKAATTMGAGSITKLIGYGAIAGEYAKKDKDGKPLYPQFAESVNKFNNAIDETINGYFANPYHISSVLTENTGKYSSESFTWDKDEAAKDKSKLLKKLNPLTGLPVLDENAPHYKEQLQEAREYVKKIILGKLDAKRELATTSQTQAQYPPEYMVKANSEAKGINAPKKENVIIRFNDSVTADLNEPTLVEELSSISDDSKFRDAINSSSLASKYGITFESAYQGNNVYIKAGDGRPESPLFPVKDSATNQKSLKAIEAWLKKNYLKGATLEDKEVEAEEFLGPQSEGGVYDEFND